MALPLGNPADASLLCDRLSLPKCLFGKCDNFGARVGFYGDYVFNRHLEVDIPGRPGIRIAEIYTNAGYLAFDYRNRVELFGTLGTSKLKMTFDQSLFGPVAGQEQITTQTDFSGSVGLRGTLLRCGGLTLGLEGQYLYFRPDLESVTIAGVEVEFDFIRQIDIRYQEWQVGVGLSYRFDIAACGATALVPYVGYKISRAQLDFHNQNFSQGSISFSVDKTEVDSARNYGGYAVGVTLVGCNKASITAEARFIEEKAFYINGQLRF